MRIFLVIVIMMSLMVGCSREQDKEIRYVYPSAGRVDITTPQEFNRDISIYANFTDELFPNAILTSASEIIRMLEARAEGEWQLYDDGGFVADVKSISQVITSSDFNYQQYDEKWGYLNDSYFVRSLRDEDNNYYVIAEEVVIND